MEQWPTDRVVSAHRSHMDSTAKHTKAASGEWALSIGAFLTQYPHLMQCRLDTLQSRKITNEELQ